MVRVDAPAAVDACRPCAHRASTCRQHPPPAPAARHGQARPGTATHGHARRAKPGRRGGPAEPGRRGGDGPVGGLLAQRVQADLDGQHRIVPSCGQAVLVPAWDAGVGIERDRPEPFGGDAQDVDDGPEVHALRPLPVFGRCSRSGRLNRHQRAPARPHPRLSPRSRDRASLLGHDGTLPGRRGMRRSPVGGQAHAIGRLRDR